MKISRLCVALTLVCVSFSAPAVVPEVNGDPRIAALEQLADFTANLPSEARARLLRAKHESLFPVDRKHSEMPAGELKSRFVAADLVSFYSADVDDMSALLLLGQELERRQISTQESQQSVLGTLIKSRMFEEARSFHSLHPDLNTEILPDIVPGPALNLTAPTALVVRPDSIELTNVVLDAPYKILVVAHPLCGFSTAAIRDIQTDPSIADIFAAHAIWLAPPERRLHLEVFRKWNTAHPAQSMLLTYRASEWPLIESWALPTFYFFQRGQLVTWFEGWPKEGNWPLLIEALELIGAAPKELPVLVPAD